METTTIKDLREQGLLLYEIISGSQTHGTATVTSDIDKKGIYVLPEYYYLTGNYIPQIAENNNNETYYEIGRFMELLKTSNPNIVEMLCVKEEFILHSSPLMHLLLRLKNKIPNKKFKYTFGQYASTQISKARGLKKKIVNPVDPKRKTPYDFCRVIIGSETFPIDNFLDNSGYKKEKCGVTNVTNAKDTYALFYDHHGEHKYRGFVKDGDLSNELRLSSVPKGEKAVAHFVYNKDCYIAHCKEYKEYFEWVAKRNNDRYQTNVEHGGDYDSKNMCHSVRLLQMAIEIAEGKGINVWRENREELLSIKRGESNYQTILAKATDLVSQMEKAFDESDLPEEMDTSEFNEIIYKIRKSLYV